MDWTLIISDSIRFGIGEFGPVFALAALGVNLQFGYAGLLNFGQAGFAAAGAYGLAISIISFGWSLWAGIAFGLFAAVVLGLLLGFPTLRLRGDYLAIVTIASAEIIRLVMSAQNYRTVTGGADGLQGFSGRFRELNPISEGSYGIWRIEFSSFVLWPMLVGWTLVVLAAILIRLLVRSPWGRVLKAIREDEDAVRSLGKNILSYKLQALILGGVLAGMAGMLDALGRGSANPANFATGFTFTYYAMVILGGTATVWGPIVGAVLFNTLLQFTILFLTQANNSFIPLWLIGDNDVGAVRLMLMGAFIMALMVFRPQGLLGDRREVAVSVRR